MALTTHRSSSASSLHTPSSMSTLARVVPRNAAPECSNLAECHSTSARRRHGSHSRRLLPSRAHRLGPTLCTRQCAPVALVGTRASVALDEWSWAIINEPEPGGEHDRSADEAKRHDRLRGRVHDAHRVGHPRQGLWVGGSNSGRQGTNGTRVHSKIHSFAYLAAARAVGGVEHSRSGKGDFHWFSFGIGRMKTTTASRGAPQFTGLWICVSTLVS